MYTYYRKCFKGSAVLLIICCFLLFTTGCCSICGDYEVSDISKYLNFDDVPIGGGSASVRLFPENLDNAETINNYYYFANFPAWGNTSWEVVLDVTYSEENFYFELERIKNFEANERNNKKLKFDCNCFLFNFPTYVANYVGNSDNQTYEYISMDESNLRIIYIYLNCPSRKNQKKYQYETKLSSDYLPKNFFNNKNSDTLDGYCFQVGIPDEKIIWFD